MRQVTHEVKARVMGLNSLAVFAHASCVELLVKVLHTRPATCSCQLPILKRWATPSSRPLFVILRRLAFLSLRIRGCEP